MRAIFFPNEKWGNLFFISFFIIYFSVLLCIAGNLYISEDEAYTLNTTSYGLIKVIRQSYFFEGQPPAYFILLSFWRYISPDVFFAKLFSILAIGLSAIFFYRTLRLISDNFNSKWLVVLFLLNPFTFWAALEMRLYSVVIFFSVCLIFYFFRYYYYKRKNDLYTFLLFCVIGLYTQYFFIFLIIGLGVSVWATKGSSEFFKFCKWQIIVMLFFVPNLFFLSDQSSLHQSHQSANSLTIIFKRIFEVLHTPQEFLLGIKLIPSGPWANRILRLIYFGALFYSLYQVSFKKNNSLKAESYFGKTLFFVFLCFILLFSSSIGLLGIVYSDKYMVASFSTFMFLNFSFLYFAKLTRKIIYIFISIYFVLLLVVKYKHPVKVYDYKSIIEYVESVEKIKEPILFYRSALSLPFKNHYTGNNQIIPLPYPVRFDTSYLVNIKDTIEIKKALAAVDSTVNSYLLISDLTEYESTLNMNREMVDNYFLKNYKTEIDTLLFGWSKSPLRIRRISK